MRGLFFQSLGGGEWGHIEIRLSVDVISTCMIQVLHRPEPLKSPREYLMLYGYLPGIGLDLSTVEKLVLLWIF